MKKLSLAFMFVLLIGLLPITASAAELYEYKYVDSDVMGDQASKKVSEGSIEYTKQSGIWLLVEKKEGKDWLLPKIGADEAYRTNPAKDPSDPVNGLDGEQSLKYTADDLTNLMQLCISLMGFEDAAKVTPWKLYNAWEEEEEKLPSNTTAYVRHIMSGLGSGSTYAPDAYGYKDGTFTLAKDIWDKLWGGGVLVDASNQTSYTPKLALLLLLYGKDHIKKFLAVNETCQIPKTTEEVTLEQDLLKLGEVEGTLPESINSYKDALLWSKAHAMADALGMGGAYAKADGCWNTYGDGLEKLNLYAIYNLNNLSAKGISVTLKKGTAAPGMDADAALYAMQHYVQYVNDGAVDSSTQKMQYILYKLKGLMALAGGTITTDTNKELVNQFMDMVKTTAPTKLLPEVTAISSKHLDTSNDIQGSYYVWLLRCYNEIASYGTTLVESLARMCTTGERNFRSEKNNLLALKGLYEAVVWADDAKLWDIWNTGVEDIPDEYKDYNSLRAIYAFCMAQGALDNLTEYDYDAESVNSPLKYFFGTQSDGTWQLSDYMLKGLSISSAYLPMQTNLYDPATYTDLDDTEWLVDFHSKFGYNRKALYIDTNADAAVNYYNTGSHGDLRVCTLEDLLNADMDIVLYLDDNLYNVDTLAELTDKAFDRLDNVDEDSTALGFFGSLKKAIVSLWDVSIENIAKTAEYTTYSSRVKKKINNQTWKDFFLSVEAMEEGLDAEDLFSDGSDHAIYYLKPDELWDENTQSVSLERDDTSVEASTYTVLTAFAVVSSVYNDTDLFNSLNSTCGSRPVFISSNALPYIDGVGGIYLRSIFNYLLLKNLDSQMTIDYASSLDMTSPVYMDIYGNIVTESGIVVVPSASNTTLWNSNYSPYNAGLLSTYGDDFLLEYDKDATALNKLLDEVFTAKDGYWQLRSLRVSGGSLDLSRLSIADKNVLASVTDVFAADLALSNAYRIYDRDVWQMIITEVLRGAPLEHIDKDFEGLNLDHRTTKQGLVIAQKLEYLVEALSSYGANTTLSIPNPAYMDGLEYVVFFVFKILVLGIIVIWMCNIYIDAVGGQVTITGTGGKCIGALILVVSLIVGVPSVFELSYYQANKLLLQDETEYLMMLNLEKKESGREIGITSVHEPEISTTLYLKLADIDIPWYSLLSDIVLSSSADTLEELYAEYEGNHPIANAKGVTVVNDGVYITTDQLFDSSTITFTDTYKALYQVASGETPASYYTPYYYFLDMIIRNVNGWTTQESYYSYTTKTQRGGKLKTYGFIQPYMTSEYFMEEGMDYFGLYTLYGVTAPMQYQWEYAENSSAVTQARNSQWCYTTLSAKDKIARIEKLNQYAREWVAEHKELMGKVSDETFLKCFALSCAMEHNRLFNTQRADYLEIYELSNEDLMRLSITDSDTVMRSSSMSYARFVYTTGGTTAVYAAAFLTLISFVSSWVKPLATLAVFCITCVSIFVFKLILRKGNNSIYGYICTILLMCSINVLGSLFIKVSMYIPNTGLSPTVCILIQIIVQILYIRVLAWVVEVAIKDWRNVGFTHYSSAFNNIVGTIKHEPVWSGENGMPKTNDGKEELRKLEERQRRRDRR